MIIMQTERLALREETADDLDVLYEILSDSETMRFYPRPKTREETLGWINWNVDSYRDNNYGHWAVILKQENRMIGQCGITNQDIDGKIVPEIGYHIHKDYWKRGYATEAARACLQYGFENLGLKKLYIHTWVKNIPSRRVAEKLGMKQLKTYDKVITYADCVMEHVVYVMEKT